MKKRWIYFLFFALALCSWGWLDLQGTSSPETMLKEIYPGCEVKIKNTMLSNEQMMEIEKLSGLKMESKMVSLYMAKKEGKLIAIGYTDIHVVRTQPEVVMYIANPNLEVDAVRIVSFKEPIEYKPSLKWLMQFTNKSLEKDKLQLRQDIASISGATMSSRAITNNCRKALAIIKTVQKKG